MRNCPSCGVQNADFSTKCEACGRDLTTLAGPTTAYRHVEDYLVRSILVTIFCCLPLGVVGIVYAAQVNGYLRNGDTGNAMAASENARFWSSLSFWLGLVGGILGLLVSVLSH